jgi:hypothetical protein
MKILQRKQPWSISRHWRHFVRKLWKLSHCSWDSNFVPPEYRWVDNIKMGFRETEWDDMDWIDLAQGRYQWRALVNTVMNIWIPYNVGKFLSRCITCCFSRRTNLHGISYLPNTRQKCYCLSPVTQLRHTKLWLYDIGWDRRIIMNLKFVGSGSYRVLIHYA